MTRLLSILVGVLIGAVLIGIVLGLVVSALVISVMALTLLVRRDWVPSAYNFRSLWGRKWTTLLTALGLGLVDGVFTEQDGSNVTVRGVSLDAFGLHPEVKVIDGRMFKPGTSEIVVGEGLTSKFANTHVGQSLKFARRSWTVVGVFDTGGSAYN